MLNQLYTFATSACQPGAEGISSKILPTWYQYLGGTVDSTGRCSLVFTFPDDLGAIGLAVIDILLRLGAFVAIAYIIVGGFKYITSTGEPDKAKGAQQTITNAIVGLVITLVATGVVTFIGGQLIK